MRVGRRLSIFSFSYLFAAVIDLLLGLLLVQKILRKASTRRANFTMEQPRVVAGNFAQSFLLKFLSIIFVDISGSTKPITLPDLDIIGKGSLYHSLVYTKIVDSVELGAR